jgi:hypothetical protein
LGEADRAVAYYDEATELAETGLNDEAVEAGGVITPWELLHANQKASAKINQRLSFILIVACLVIIGVGILLYITGSNSALIAFLPIIAIIPLMIARFYFSRKE